jgi:hypothetical protein
VNLFSHIIAKRNAYKIKDELDELDKSDTSKVNNFNNRVKRRNNTIDILNSFSIISLFGGISLIVLFASLNILQESKETETKECLKNELFIDSTNISLKLKDYNFLLNDTILKIEKNGKKNNK